MGTGKKNDVFNQILTWRQSRKKNPKLIILDIPRTNLDFVNYDAIEQIKNGTIYLVSMRVGDVSFQDLR